MRRAVADGGRRLGSMWPVGNARSDQLPALGTRDSHSLSAAHPSCSTNSATGSTGMP